MKELINGLLTGLTLQLAVGPVFFFIVNLTIQKSFYDGMAGVLAVTTVDYLYIISAILGIGKLLEHKKFKKIFGITSSLVLALFGLVIIKGALGTGAAHAVVAVTSDVFASFGSVFLLTISSPLTIVFFTSLFTAKAVEYGYTKKELLFFGIGTGLATLLFMGTSVVAFSVVKGAIPVLIVKIMNMIVGGLLVGYGMIRLVKTTTVKQSKL